MLTLNRKANREMQYATGIDFCRIFATDMNRLYLLGLLLTGDRAMAERCFVTGLEDSTKRNTVFKEWAQSWARRKIIQNAIEIIRPQTTTVGAPLETGARNWPSSGEEPAEMAAVIDLPAFERFVFVMSVLERYPVHECSILLSTTHREVAEARVRALRRIGSSLEGDRKLGSVSCDDWSPKNLRESTEQLGPISALATSA